MQQEGYGAIREQLWDMSYFVWAVQVQSGPSSQPIFLAHVGAILALYPLATTSLQLFLGFRTPTYDPILINGGSHLH